MRTSPDSSLAFQLTRREAIHDLEPELRLPPPNRKPNPVFARNEITRLALDVHPHLDRWDSSLGAAATIAPRRLIVQCTVNICPSRCKRPLFAAKKCGAGQ